MLTGVAQTGAIQTRQHHVGVVQTGDQAAVFCINVSGRVCPQRQNVSVIADDIGPLALDGDCTGLGWASFWVVIIALWMIMSEPVDAVWATAPPFMVGAAAIKPVAIFSFSPGKVLSVRFIFHFITHALSKITAVKGGPRVP